MINKNPKNLHTRKTNFYIFILLLIILTIISAAWFIHYNVASKVKLYVNSQYTCNQNIKIGNGSCVNDGSTNSCKLWIYVKDQPQLNKVTDVEENDKIRIDDTTIYIKDISANSKGKYALITCY